MIICISCQHLYINRGRYVHAILCPRPCVAAKLRAAKPPRLRCRVSRQSPRVAAKPCACHGKAAYPRVPPCDVPRAAKPRVKAACRGKATSRMSACRGEAALRPALRSGTASSMLILSTQALLTSKETYGGMLSSLTLLMEFLIITSMYFDLYLRCIWNLQHFTHKTLYLQQNLFTHSHKSYMYMYYQHQHQ